MGGTSHQDNHAGRGGHHIRIIMQGGGGGYVLQLIELGWNSSMEQKAY